jgi:hypothetical protein
MQVLQKGEAFASPFFICSKQKQKKIQHDLQNIEVRIRQS